MTRVIYSLYIDIPEDELDWQKPYYGETEPKTIKTKRVLKEYYSWLRSMHEQYAENIGVEYKLFEYDKKYEQYKNWFKSKYPEITSYNIVNFYKIHLMYELANQYDELLYLDFDAIPLANKNFFDEWDLSKGVAILTNRTHVDTSLHAIKQMYKDSTKGYTHSIRSPTAKYWNCRAMLIENNHSGQNEVYNTGIIGINKHHLDQLDYWNDFKDTIEMMTDLRKDKNSMWPDHIQSLFGFDNETIWSYKMRLNNVSKQWLSDDWHHFMDKWNYVPVNTNIVHVINKNFEYVKDWYEKNNL